jgi:catechol 2,3-dioxygenase-like lactoylglutathione lyase family enzyme
MTIELDHLILPVSDRAKSIEFYGRILGFMREPDDGPFFILRVAPGFVILLAEGPTEGGEHLAFSMTKSEFDAAFARIKSASIPYGDRYDRVGAMNAPSDELGARGMGKSLYFFDPDRHLIEIRHYDQR